jgi:hypothetical protein
VFSAEKIESFANVRVRMQRTSDAKFFSGWVKTLSEREIMLEFASSEWFSPGTRFFLTANGLESTALFPAEVIQQTSGLIRLGIVGPVKFARPTEEARKSMIGLTCIMHIGEVEVEMLVHDVSAKGMGGTIDGAVARGRVIDFDVDTPHGSVIGKAEVRYCRQEGKDTLKHRIGLRILSMGRVETTRWLRLSDENAA